MSTKQQMNNINEYLIELGLTDIQSDVYKYILINPGVGITEISVALNINRSHLYAIGRKLADLELIYEDFTSKMQLYPNDLGKVGERLKEKSVQLSDKYDSFNKNLELMKELVDSSNIKYPRMQVFHGVQGKKTAVGKLLSNANRFATLYLMTNQKVEKDIFTNEDHDDFISKRVSLEIPIKVLAVDNEEGRALGGVRTDILRETILLEKGFYFESEIYVIKNTVLLFDLVPEVVGLMIESEQMARIYKGLFEVAWRSYSQALHSSTTFSRE